jgi:hypothetical protein
MSCDLDDEQVCMLDVPEWAEQNAPERVNDERTHHVQRTTRRDVPEINDGWEAMVVCKKHCYCNDSRFCKIYLLRTTVTYDTMA